MKRLALILALAPLLMGATRHVSTTGTDSGSAYTEETAWATLEYALDNCSPGDSIIVLEGTYSGAAAPSEASITQGGTAGDLTYVLADTGATVIFDGTGIGANGCAIYGQTATSDYIQFENLTFEDYLDDMDATDSRAIFFWYVNALDLSEIHIVNCRFVADDSDSIQTAVLLNNAATAGTVTNFSFSGNYCEGMSNIPVRIITYGENFLIENNHLERWPNFTAPAPGGDLNGYKDDGEATDIVIRDNVLVGYRHGIYTTAKRIRIIDNTFFDLYDDCIVLYSGTRDATVRGNIGWHSRNNGVDCKGDSVKICHNTFFDMYDDFFFVASTADSIVLQSNVCHTARNSAANYVNIAAGAGSVYVENNVYYDPSEDATPFVYQGTPYNFTNWQALGFDTESQNSNPAFVDTTNKVLYLKSNSPAIHLGHDGRTAGALPCGECYWWKVNTSGSMTDSVHVLVRKADGSIVGFWWNGGIWRNENSFILDMDLDSTSIGQHRAAWSIFAGSHDSTMYHDDVHVTVDIEALIAADVDTNLSAASGDTNMVSAAYIADTTASAVHWANMAIEWANNTHGDFMNDIHDATIATGVPLKSGQYALITADLLNELIAGYDTEGTVGDLLNDLQDSTTFADTSDVAFAVDRRLSNAHEYGPWSAGSLGNGEYDHVIALKDSSTSAMLSGARLSVWDTLGVTQHVNASTPLSGLVASHLDDGIYEYRADDPGVYNPRTGRFTVTADNETTVVKLLALSIPDPGDPSLCTLVVDVAQIYGAASAESIRVCAGFMGSLLGADGLTFMSEAACDTCDETGRVELPLPRSSELVPVRTDDRYWVELSEGAVLREDNPRDSIMYERITLPDTTTINLQDARN